MNDQNVRYTQGLGIRREVLGDEHVTNSLNNATAFSQPMQDLVTEYCWGLVWTSPGLDRKSRSLINLGILTAMNRQHELAAHVRGAIRNGCSASEIQEVLLQTAIYCGVPAALDAFRTANAVLQTLAQEQGTGSPDSPATPDNDLTEGQVS